LHKENVKFEACPSVRQLADQAGLSDWHRPGGLWRLSGKITGQIVQVYKLQFAYLPSFTNYTLNKMKNTNKKQDNK